MRKITLKDNSVIYIDKYNNKDERCRVYDSNKRYIEYLFSYGEGATDKETKKEYKDFIKYAQNELDSYDLFNYFCQRFEFDYGTSPKEIMETYIDDITACQSPLEFGSNLKAEVQNILFDLYFHTDEELCEIYDINKIGKTYFRGNW